MAWLGLRQDRPNGLLRAGKSSRERERESVCFSLRRAPQFLNSLVQIWYHLGYFRSARTFGDRLERHERPGRDLSLAPLRGHLQRLESLPALGSQEEPGGAGDGRGRDRFRAPPRISPPLLQVLPALREIFVRLQAATRLCTRHFEHLPCVSTGRFRPAVPCSARPSAGRAGRKSARPAAVNRHVPLGITGKVLQVTSYMCFLCLVRAGSRTKHMTALTESVSQLS